MLAVRNANGFRLFPVTAPRPGPTAGRASAKRVADGPRPRAPASAPLAALAGGALARRFRAFRGASGRRYVFSSMDVDEIEAADFAMALVIVCEFAPDGSLEMVRAFDTGALPALALAGARRAGAGAARREWHVHLLAESAAERAAALDDLRRGFGAPSRA